MSWSGKRESMAKQSYDLRNLVGGRGIEWLHINEGDGNTIIFFQKAHHHRGVLMKGMATLGT